MTILWQNVPAIVAAETYSGRLCSDPVRGWPYLARLGVVIMEDDTLKDEQSRVNLRIQERTLILLLNGPGHMDLRPPCIHGINLKWYSNRGVGFVTD
ncbi:hypothetical protein ACO22_05365 [Paracoccidioides brasiliensis]|uniref:Uncharacterized protein n=1 Tax=Paracoccidioides brasiliensis TaxID=121759 RepID=A0A1D2JAJ9_PARBR|nr:hypothetical protein ACO22_05365 [Paracoccidioides brasiliensis]